MRQIKIYRLQENGKQKVVVLCTYDGNEAKLEGEKSFVDHLTKNGQKDRRNNKILYPKDGKEFFELLKKNFNSPYLSAVEK